MQKLGGADTRQMLDFLANVYASEDLDEFANATCKGIGKLIACDIATYNEIDPIQYNTRAIIYPILTDYSEMTARLISVMDDHPLFAYHAAHPESCAVKISDLLSNNQFRSRRTYADFYKHIRTEHVMAVNLRAGEALEITVGLLRGRARDFSERDRRLLNALQPHLAQAYRIANATGKRKREIVRLHSGLDSLDQGLVVVEADYRVNVMSARARQLLAKYFLPCARGALPEPLDAWLRLLTTAAGELPLLRTPFIAEGAARRLVVRLSGTDNYTLILEEEMTALQPADLAHLGLTPRETELLAWLARGKTNAVIAQILSLSPRTVHHTVERIYRKLGVETRAAAVARAYQALRYGCAE